MTEKIKKEIFTFWEPKNKVPPYLELCRATWGKNLPEYTIITLDYSNISDQFDEKVFDLVLLKTLPLKIQKDAVMVAVLKEQGGMFMDMDTLILKDISPILGRLKNTEVVMFNKHCAFMAARPNARLLSIWLKGIQKQILQLKPRQETNTNVEWGYLGNSVLDEIMAEMVGQRNCDLRWIISILDKTVQLYQKSGGTSFSFIKLANRVKDSLLCRRRDFLFRSFYKRYLEMLDRRKYGFIREVLYYRKNNMSAKEKYLKYWFESGLDAATVLGSGQMIIGLHNSWTPQWYQELTERRNAWNIIVFSQKH